MARPELLECFAIQGVKLLLETYGEFALKDDEGGNDRLSVRVDWEAETIHATLSPLHTIGGYQEPLEWSAKLSDVFRIGNPGDANPVDGANLLTSFHEAFRTEFRDQDFRDRWLSKWFPGLERV
jgi:hypothetical protein